MFSLAGISIVYTIIYPFVTLVLSTTSGMVRSSFSPIIRGTVQKFRRFSLIFSTVPTRTYICKRLLALLVKVRIRDAKRDNCTCSTCWRFDSAEGTCGLPRPHVDLQWVNILQHLLFLRIVIIRPFLLLSIIKRVYSVHPRPMKGKGIRVNLPLSTKNTSPNSIRSFTALSFMRSGVRADS